METSQDRTITVREWLLTLLVSAIPVIGLIMMFVWAFGGGAPPSKANWAKAMLLWMVIGFALAFGFLLLFVLFAASLPAV
jgi:hypothetical protein